MLPVYILIIECLKNVTNEATNWTRIKEMFVSFDILSHLFLLHNLSPEWVCSINPVLWSLATEWWIYFFFALVLLPVWRHFGVSSAVFVSIVLSLLPLTTKLLGLPTINGSPHLLGAFGLGMLSAALLFNSKFTSQYILWHKIMTIVAALVFIVFCWAAIFIPSVRLETETQWSTDLLIAVVCAIFILLLASAVLHEEKAFRITKIVVQGLGSRPLVFLGHFSYSLYLTHLVTWSILGITLGLAPVKRLISFSLDPMPVRIFLAIPLLLISAYGFYLLFEKPFLCRRG
jgi:peptidoglycan/LPS O-acetylase OafA/YrhL